MLCVFFRATENEDQNKFTVHMEITDYLGNELYEWYMYKQ